MMKTRPIIFTLLLTMTCLGGFSVSALAQLPSEDRAEFEDRRKSILDANNLRATYHNYGFAGRASGADELVFEFPKNTNRWYIYFVSIFMGAEVENQGGTGSERFPIVIAPNYRTNPQTGDSWSMNPIPGYFNPESSEIARSDRGPTSPLGSTWPMSWPDKMDDESDPGWAGQWNGFFGKGIFNADQEFFYRAGDDSYTRYINNNATRFRPFQDAPERGGLGLVMDSRILAWTQNLIADVHFNIFEIRNDSPNHYDKVSFMLWTADWVGTPSDDEPFFDQQRSTAFFTDARPTAAPPEFDNTTIGVAAVRFLETPGNAQDGIDNDGDADCYIPGSPFCLDDRANLFSDLITPLTQQGGGFFPDQSTVVNQVVPQFTAESFNPRTLQAGSPIVLIDENNNRILTRYPSLGPDEEVTVVSQGREIRLTAAGPIFPGSTSPTNPVREDTLLGRHLNLFDDNFNGLIDENQPNHLTLSQFRRDGTLQTRAVRHINYLYEGFYENILSFADRDTIQRGLVVPNSWIRNRMNEEENFRRLVVDYQEMLTRLYAGVINPVTQQPFDFSNYFQNFHTSAPMIDESREDFFDNNANWTAAADDVGRDGVEGTGSRGEGDGFPSSGAFTPFPGESNIDKTDVAETDAIGITSATFRPAGSLNLSGPDIDLWQTHMIPGRFMQTPDASQDTDQFITSSFFPLAPGSTERFAVAITAAQANTPTNAADIDLVINNLSQAFNAYEANYQFATAPPPPILGAVPGDGRVTLYWDDAAEFVFDRYLERLGQNPNNFEGYKVYRSTDPALLDARTITDGRGNIQFLRPIAQFDRINEFSGNHPIDINGVEFFLGNNSGLQRYYIDTDVINGRQYYYAVVAYNHGAPGAGIAPSESPINLSINPDGTLIPTVNVKQVTPRTPSAGYVGPRPPQVVQVAGASTGEVIADIVDSEAAREFAGSTYRVVFGAADSTLTDPSLVAENFSLINVTSGRTILSRRASLNGEDSPVVQGIRLVLRNPAGASKLYQGSWKTQSDVNIAASITANRVGEGSDRNYTLVFDAHSTSITSSEITVNRGSIRQRVPSVQSNVRVLDADTGEQIPFAILRNLDIPNRNQAFSGYFDGERNRNFSDILYILDDDGSVAYQVELHPHDSDIVFRPMKGDQVDLLQAAPFTLGDVFEFNVDENANLESVDTDLARQQLENIRVVPNPYIVTNLTERRPTPVSPQQERQLHFINLPSRATIRIFNVAGHLVQTLEVNNTASNGMKTWNMLTKDNLELSYGVYIYHVEAPGIGEHTGKFAVIK
ncbi:MAG: T9SS type A sorting domain-containing protein [Bacteroidetes bacterium]|nr:T9SS type A sorting domain-containing protein [Bacteroidota bacterium]MCH8524304.1 hypothetical protein [Balneolales bacterium]